MKTQYDGVVPLVSLKNVLGEFVTMPINGKNSDKIIDLILKDMEDVEVFGPDFEAGLAPVEAFMAQVDRQWSGLLEIEWQETANGYMRYECPVIGTVLFWNDTVKEMMVCEHDMHVMTRMPVADLDEATTFVRILRHMRQKKSEATDHATT